MARIFSISFEYTDNVYNAIISVQKTPFYTEYHINMADERINDLLPTNKIVSTSPGHYAFSGISSTSHSPLMDEIITAVANHMHLHVSSSEQ